MPKETDAMTPVFRASYPFLFKPQETKRDDGTTTIQYSVTALFPAGTDFTAMKKAAHAATIKKWGPNQAVWPQNIRSPFRDQGEKVKKDKVTGLTLVDDKGQPVLQDGCVKGAIFLNLKNKSKPDVVDQQVQDIMDQSEVYSGCYMKASVNAYGYDHKGNRGVAFGLNNIQKVKDGVPLGATRTKASDDFSAVEGEAAAAGDGSASALFG